MIRLQGRVQGLEQTRAALSQISESLMSEMDSATRASLFMVTRTAQKSYLSGPRPERLGVVTNRLRSSLSEGRPDFVFDLQRQQATIKGSIGTNVPYASVHEYGARLRAKSGGHLFIPARSIRTAAGALKDAYNRSLRDIPNTYVRPNPRGGWYVFQRVRKGLSELIGVLKKEVNIPPRPFMGPALKDSTPWIMERFAQGLRRAEQRLSNLLKGR